MKYVYIFLCFIAFAELRAQFACGHAANRMAALNGPSINNNGKSDTVDILHYHLDLDMYQIASGQMKGRADIRFTPKQSNVNAFTLDLLKLTVDSIVQNGQILSYHYNDTLLRISLLQAVSPGDTAGISVYYQGIPQGDATGWGGFHRQSGYYYNLGVGFGADPHTYGRAWFPCFDNFVEKSTYSFEVLTQAPNRAFCNGLQTAYIVSGDSARSVFMMQEPIPTYLASIAISNYALVEDQMASGGRNIPIWLMAKAGDTANMKASFRNLKAVTQSFIQHYGPYEWSKIGYAATTVGAMEHATSIHYPISAINGNLGSEDLMAHELAHHWWGNLVTCESDADMWINEGMAEYSSHLYTEQVYGYENYIDIVQENAAQVLKLAHTRDGGYLPLYGLDHGDVYGFHVYQKGAMVGHNLRTYLGYAAFDGIVTNLMANHKYGNLSTAGMQQALEQLSGKNLTDFFDQWIYQPGYPQFGVDALSSNSLDISQGLYQAPNLYQNVPVDVTFFSATGDTSSRTFMHSGLSGSYNHNLPFTPAFALTGYNGRLLSATTTDELLLTQNRFYLLPRTGLRVTASNWSDTIRFIAQQHWAQARDFANSGIRLSADRYWTVQGYAFEKADLSLRFSYNANDPLLEDELLRNGEDSIGIYYRVDGTQAWQFVADQQKFKGANPNDGQGFVEIESVLPGEYVFANAAPDISLPELKKEKSFEVYPNPTREEVKVKLKEMPKQQALLRIQNVEGRLLKEVVLRAQENRVSLKDLASQPLLFVLHEEVVKVVME